MHCCWMIVFIVYSLFYQTAIKFSQNKTKISNTTIYNVGWQKHETERIIGYSIGVTKPAPPFPLPSPPRPPHPTPIPGERLPLPCESYENGCPDGSASTAWDYAGLLKTLAQNAATILKPLLPNPHSTASTHGATRFWLGYAIPP